MLDISHYSDRDSDSSYYEFILIFLAFMKGNTLLVKCGAFGPPSTMLKRNIVPDKPRLMVSVPYIYEN